MKRIIMLLICILISYALYAQNKYGTYTVKGGPHEGVYKGSDSLIEGIQQYNPAAANALKRGRNCVFKDSYFSDDPISIDGCEYQDWAWLLTEKDYKRWCEGYHIFENGRILQARKYVDNLKHFDPRIYQRTIDLTTTRYLSYGIVEGKVKVLPTGDYSIIKERLRGYLNWNWFKDENGQLPDVIKVYPTFKNQEEADLYTNSIRDIIDHYDFWTRIEEGTLTDQDVAILEMYGIKLNLKFDQQQIPINSNKGQYQSSGSGFILSSNGIIVTNYHVIADANGIDILINRNGEVKTYNAKILISDKTNDISILKIEDSNFTKLPALPYAINTRILDVGSKVFALGYPMSNILGEEIKLTDGLISSKTGYQGDIVTYQISAPIQPGNSGGPLFDQNGNIVGITNAGVPDAQNVGYAIKTSYLKNLIDVAPETISLPKQNSISGLSFTEKIKRLTPYVVLIKVY